MELDNKIKFTGILETIPSDLENLKSEWLSSKWHPISWL